MINTCGSDETTGAQLDDQRSDDASL